MCPTFEHLFDFNSEQKSRGGGGGSAQNYIKLPRNYLASNFPSDAEIWFGFYDRSLLFGWAYFYNVLGGGGARGWGGGIVCIWYSSFSYF